MSVGVCVCVRDGASTCCLVCAYSLVLYQVLHVVLVVHTLEYTTTAAVEELSCTQARTCISTPSVLGHIVKLPYYCGRGVVQKMGKAAGGTQ